MCTGKVYRSFLYCLITYYWGSMCISCFTKEDPVYLFYWRNSLCMFFNIMRFLVYLFFDYVQLAYYWKFMVLVHGDLTVRFLFQQASAFDHNLINQTLNFTIFLFCTILSADAFKMKKYEKISKFKDCWVINQSPGQGCIIRLLTLDAL